MSTKPTSRRFTSALAATLAIGALAATPAFARIPAPDPIPTPTAIPAAGDAPTVVRADDGFDWGSAAIGAGGGAAIVLLSVGGLAATTRIRAGVPS